MMKHVFYPQQAEWAQRAEALRRPLRRRCVMPLTLVETVADSSAWQGIAIRSQAPAAAAFAEWHQWPRTYCFDFGCHLTGRIELEIETDRLNDSPLRLEFKFAETPYELATDFGTYSGHLDRSWLQDEILMLDEIPPVIRLPRRYALRYCRLKVGAPNYSVRLKSLRAITETAVDESAPPPAPAALTPLEREIDRINLATLRDCMQEVFEDGPKRDRRLWLGDLRIEALANAFTYRNFELVERCLYMLAALAGKDGWIPGAAYDRGGVFASSCQVPTYALLFGPTLWEHLQYSHHERCARDLFEVALRQLELFGAAVDGDGMLRAPKDWWLFIDHDAQLERETAALGVYIFALRRTAKLADALNQPHPELSRRADELSARLRQRAYDPALGLFRADGPTRQISYATQAWMLMAEVPDAAVSQQVWDAMWKNPAVHRPHTPYLWSTVLEAGWKLHRYDAVREFISEYWGGMARRGADTFWEVYVPDNPLFSSYGDCLMNSACHAWSCIPGYFLRQLPSPDATFIQPKEVTYVS